MTKKRDIVQVKNLRTQRYIKIDRGNGVIISLKRSEGPYKGVLVARKNEPIAIKVPMCPRDN